MTEQVFPFRAEIAHELQTLERRIAQRQACSVLASCFVDPTREFFWGNICDISLTGIGIVIDRELRPGTRLLIQIRKACEDSLFAVAARVAHSSMQAEGRWVAGCKFIGDLTDEDLRAVLWE
ncbi:MAG TPA: PilZ domain-containing protein [Gemmataceae bacterium]|nr:PilZ domain-containing protein [Gemmataceae bacterium]